MSNSPYPNYFNLPDESKVYLAPDIPLKKLSAALASYGGDTQPEEVILLVDDTVFGSATEGFMLTRNKLFYKELALSPRRMILTGTPSYVFKAQRGFLKTFICDGDTKLFSVTQIGLASVNLICMGINKMVRDELKAEEARSTTPTSDETESGSEYKRCPLCGETIRAVAIKCRFCGERLDGTAAEATGSEECGLNSNVSPIHAERGRSDGWDESCLDYNVGHIQSNLILWARQNVTRDMQDYLRENEDNPAFKAAFEGLKEKAQQGDVEAIHTCGIILRTGANNADDMAKAIRLIALAAYMEHLPSMIYIGQAYRMFTEGNCGAQEKASYSCIISIASDHCSPEYCERKTRWSNPTSL